MGWSKQSYAQSLHGKLLVKQDFISKHKQRNLGLTTIIATVLLCPVEISALEPAPAARIIAQTSVPKIQNGLRTMTEEDLRRVAAQGLTDRLFERISRYASNGNGVEVLGDTATLLNPVLALLDADTTFKNAVFNPTNPSIIIDGNGAALMRLSSSIGELSFRNIHIRGSGGTSFGSVLIRGIDLGGTTVKVSRH